MGAGDAGGDSRLWGRLPGAGRENQQGGNAGSIPADDLLAMSWRDFPWLISGRRCGYAAEVTGRNGGRLAMNERGEIRGKKAYRRAEGFKRKNFIARQLSPGDNFRKIFTAFSPGKG